MERVLVVLGTFLILMCLGITCYLLMVAVSEYQYRHRPCPNCGRRWALQKTGRRKDDGKMAEGPFIGILYEY